MHTLFRVFALFALVLLPTLSFAHEVRTYEINGVPYEIVMGSLGEPVIVDDKTGIDLEVIRNGEPLVGAQEGLQVEMIAGDVKKTVSLSPVYGSEGKYKSHFIATVPTTLTYRLFGTLEETPIDISFTCNPAGHPQSEEVTERMDVSDGVVQTLKQGAFGCPQEKGPFGFPEAAPNLLSLEDTMAASEKAPRDPYQNVAVVALVVGLLGLGLSLRNSRKK